MTALRSLVRPLLALVLGFALPSACDRAFRGLRPEWTPGPPRVWVADRDAGRLVALDRELYVAAAAELVAPIAVAARADGGAWALDAVERRPGGALALVRVDARGAVRATLSLGSRREAPPRPRDALLPPRDAWSRPGDAPPPDLCALDGGEALVCVPGLPDARSATGDARIVEVDAAGRISAELHRPHARAVAGRGRMLLVGGSDGGLAAFDRALGHVLVGLGALGAPVLDVAPAPRGDWWVLTGPAHTGSRDPPGAERRLWLVGGAALEPLWQGPVDLAAVGIAAAAANASSGAPLGANAGADTGANGVWLVSTTSAQARLQAAFRPPAETVRGLPLGGFGAAAARADGALYLPAPGALLELDAAGRLARSQGGFDFLVAASCVP